MPYRQRLNVTLARLLLPLPLLALAGQGAQAADIHLLLVGAKPETQGPVHAALMPITERQWQAEPLQTLRAVENLRFSDVAPGRYAVQLFVDLNGNGTLDSSPRGIPREPVGFSNNPSLLKGLPGIQAAAFGHGTQPLELTIRLRQPPRVAGRLPSETTR